LKPDTIGRSIVGEIISRFEKVWLHIVAMKMTRPDENFLHHHYETIGQMISRRWQKAFDITIKYLTKLPVIAIVLEWVEAVEYVRKMVWTTEPKAAMPWTIRWDYSHMSFAYANTQDSFVANLVHASWNIDEAKEEIKHRFKQEEISITQSIYTLEITNYKYFYLIKLLLWKKTFMEVISKTLKLIVYVGRLSQSIQQFLDLSK
jgi:nucleoside-diphosphate kinase